MRKFLLTFLILNFPMTTAMTTATEQKNTCTAHLSHLKPLDFAQKIESQGFRHVQINAQHIFRVAQVLSQSEFQITMATWDFPPYPGKQFTLNMMFEYFLTLDSINYMYQKQGKTFSQGGLQGAALVAERLTQNWLRLSQPGVLANLSEVKAAQLFSATHPLPSLEKRVAHLRAVGQFLDQHRGVDWNTWLEQFPFALDLALYISRTIDGFDDPFLKRAQLFVGMLIGRYNAQLPPGLRNLNDMTVYADYILPMVLVRMGILSYSNELEQKIRNNKLIAANSNQELEIRAATVLASRDLLKILNLTDRYKNEPINILSLDAALWLQGGEIVFRGSEMPSAVFIQTSIPHHKTYTTHY